MNERTRIRTSAPFTYLILIAVSAAGAVLAFRLDGDPLQRQLKFVLLVYAVLYSLFLFARSILCPDFLTEEGIERWRFGRLEQTIPWSQVVQVSLLNRYRISFKTSQVPVIAITPTGCPAFDGKQHSSIYLRKYRKQLIRVEHSRNSIRFIEAHWGPVARFD